MQTGFVQNIWQSQCLLGEGPMWHPHENGLYWVDILDKKLYFFDPQKVAYQHYQFDKMPGAVVPTNTHQYLLISFEDGIAQFDTHTQSLSYLVHYHQNEPNMRANDGKCDPFGNFWVGTMSKTCENEAGGLYVFNIKKGLQPKVKNVTISNGLCWSTDGKTMYYIDTFAFTVRAFDCDENANLTNERIILEDKNKEYGYFDGMTIDTDGMLWIAHCTAGYIAQWNPQTGQMLQKFELPVPKCTSLTFGGENYDTLFITSAQEHLSAQEITQYPQSGDLFQLKTNAKGFKTHEFKLI